MLAPHNASHTVTVNGDTEIFYTEIGTGDPVVLLHGGGPGASGMSNYARNVDALASRFRVIVPDLPGYGRSSKNLEQTDPFGALAEAIRALLDHLGLDTAHLVGNSYGGACALRLATARYWRETCRAAMRSTSAVCAGRVLATTISPLVSLSSRCTMPARGKRARALS